MELAERDPKDHMLRESTTGALVGPGLYQLQETAFDKPEIMRRKRHSVSHLHQSKTAGHSLYSETIQN